MLKEYADKNNYNIVGIYNDAGYSGKNLMRPEMQRLLKDIKLKNRFRYLENFEDEKAIGTKIVYLKIKNSTLKKYMPIENDKDNAN